MQSLTLTAYLSFAETLADVAGTTNTPPEAVMKILTDTLTAAIQAARTTADTIPLDQLTLLAPIERPGKYLAIGMNTLPHLASQGT